MTREATRRTVLETGAAVGSLAVVGSMAGCSSLLGGGGGADYTDWLYAPGAVGDRNHYFFSFLDDREIRAHEDNLGGYNETEQTSQFPLTQMNLDYEAVDTRTRIGLFGFTQVVTGSFSESDVTGELEDNDFSEGDEYEGYTFFTREQRTDFGGTQTSVVAVSGSTAIGAQSFSGSDSPDPQEAAETAIDTEAGEENRYVDESDDMALLVDELGDATVVFGGTGAEITEENATNESGSFFGRAFAGQVASGRTSTIEGETTEERFIRMFADSSDIDIDTIEGWTDTASQFEDLDNVEISESGRAAIVTGERDTEGLINESE